MNKLALFGSTAAVALMSSSALGQQVPNPINAPASITAGHPYCTIATNRQQSQDCGTVATTPGNTNISIAAQVFDEETTGNTSLAAASTWTLPCSTSQPYVGYRVLTGDAAGLINNSNNIVVAANASSCSDTIDGASTVTIGLAHAGIEFETISGGYHVVGDTLLQSTSAVAHNWVTNIDANGIQHISQPAFSDLVGSPNTIVILNSIGGCTPSNDGTTPNTVLDIATCQAADSTGAVMMQQTGFTKLTGGAWASGSGSNAMGNGLTITANTWYHVCMANNGGTPDYWFDTAINCGNRPSGISDTKHRVIAHFLTDASAHIIAYQCKSVRDCTWATAINDVNFVSKTTGTALQTLTVPSGVKVVWKGIIQADEVSGVSAGDSTGLTDPATSTQATPIIIQISSSHVFNGGYAEIGTNTASQANLVVTSTGTISVNVRTYGWQEPGLGIDH